MSRFAFRTTLAVGCALVFAACGDGDGKKDAAPKIDARLDAAAPTPDTAVADRAGDTSSAAEVGDVVARDGGAERTDAVAGEGGVGDAGNPAQIARGKYLVDNVSVCQDCHTPRLPSGAPDMTKYLAGAECFIKLPNNHCLHTRNLTNHSTGLMNRSADEIKKMFLDGIRPTTTGDVALSPVMPYWVYHNMTTADADAIVAYLRTVPGVMHEVPRSDVEFDVPVHANYLDLASIPVPADTYVDKPSAMRGRYLTSQAGVCIECHTKHQPPPSLDVIKAADYFTGGEEFPIGLPVTPVSKNLTSDEATGLGKWSLEDIRHVLRDGKDRNDQGICPPMPVGPMGPFGQLTAGDMTDIAHYIKSLPAKANMIVDMCTFPPPPPDGGTPDAPAAGDGGVADAATD